MKQAIDMLIQIRTRLARSLEECSTEELLWVPTGLRNNILWNAGHLLVSQQGLHYWPAGAELHVSSELVHQFRKGSSPSDWTETPDVDLVLRLLTEVPERLPEDYASGRLSTYQGYTTSTGFQMDSIEAAITFNLFHEGLHTGVIQTYQALWRTAGSGARPAEL